MLPMRTGDENGPTTEVGYAQVAPAKWSMWTADMEENAAELRWPMSVRVYHRMRTDAQIDALLRAITLPIRRSRWVVDPNGARDEVVERIAGNLNLPVRGMEDPPSKRTRGFIYDDHMRQSLLGLVYGFMFFEKVGDIDPSGMWSLTKLAPRMPMSIQSIEVNDVGDLLGIKQWPKPGDPFQGKLIPANGLAPYVWDMEGGNWTGRSILRSCYKFWLLKDRLLRVDAIKNERFGAGIPYAGAPPGATRDTIERYASMARAIRADAEAGVGLPHQGDIGVEGIRGTLPDTLASIHYYDEQIARSFLAMILMLASGGNKGSGSRALGESFVDFFKMGVDAVADWHATVTTMSVVDPMVDWNYGADETVPLIDWDEDPESRMDASDLTKLIETGAIVVDDELRTWISDRWGVSDPGPNTPTPPGPSISTTMVPQPTPGEEPAAPPPAALPAAASGRAVAATGHTHGVRHPVARTHRRQTRAARRAAAGGAPNARSQTLGRDHSERVGHRNPNAVELAAKTDFTKLQTQWEAQTTKLVDAYRGVRSTQIDELVAAVEAAVRADDIDALANVMADTDGADVISAHMRTMFTDALATVTDEIEAQGGSVGDVATDAAVSRMTRIGGAVADIITQAISYSAASQGLQRYGTTSLDPATVASGVRTHLEGLSDSYLEDQLGGALTQAQNTARMTAFGELDGATFYASELLDENTCEACLAEDGTTFDTLDDAMEDYPAGGYSECAGGPRCRGTVVAVLPEASTGES